MRKKRNDNAENSINSEERISFLNLDQQICSERKKRDEREKGWRMKEGGEGYFTVRSGVVNGEGILELILYCWDGKLK